MEIDRENLVVHVEILVGMLRLEEKVCRFVDLGLPNESLSDFTWFKRSSVVVIVSDPLLFVVVILYYIEVLLPEIHSNIHKLFYTFFVHQLDHVVPDPLEFEKNLFGRFLRIHQVVGDLMDFLLGEHISNHESVTLLGYIDVYEFGEIGADNREEVISSILLHVNHLPL